MTNTAQVETSRPRSKLPVLLPLVPLSLLMLAAVTIRLPYYAFSPGSAPSVTDLVELRHDQRFPPEGDILLTSVSLKTVTTFEALKGWLDPHTDVFRAPRVLGGEPTPRSRREFERQSEISMEGSREDAVLAAVRYLGMPFDEHGSGAVVGSVVQGSGADGRLNRGDVITSVNGRPTPLAPHVSSVIRAHQPGQSLRLEVAAPDGSKRVVDAVLGKRPDDGAAFLGVTMQTKDYRVTYPFDIGLRRIDVGGPSGGLAFTLALVDWLTPGELTGGQRVATAGTITTDGRVGPVDGIPQKVAAARRSGASFFLVPLANFDTATRHGGDKMKVISVTTLDEAVNALGRVGGDLSGLPPRPPEPR